MNNIQRLIMARIALANRDPSKFESLYYDVEEIFRKCPLDSVVINRTEFKEDPDKFLKISLGTPVIIFHEDTGSIGMILNAQNARTICPICYGGGLVSVDYTTTECSRCYGGGRIYEYKDLEWNE